MNVLVSGLLSRTGAPALLLERWLDGDFELVVSEHLLSELEATLRLQKIRTRIAQESGTQFLALIRELGHIAAGPAAPPPIRSSDQEDDYLITLAAGERAHIVTGDAHLLDLEGRIPVLTPRAALELLA